MVFLRGSQGVSELSVIAPGGCPSSHCLTALTEKTLTCQSSSNARSLAQGCSPQPESYSPNYVQCTCSCCLSLASSIILIHFLIYFPVAASEGVRGNKHEKKGKTSVISCQTVTMLFNNYHSHRCAKTPKDTRSELIHIALKSDCAEVKTRLRY